ncbi:MAG: hypothetical protein M9894_23185 [Planctomycetes bacterium]|nr:hypothetical protein [Planctomycetota bacterium]
MSLTTSRPHAASMLRFLEQRSEQLEVFHSGNARLVVQQFCDFLDRDDVLSFLSQTLQRRVDTSPKAWHERALREGSAPPLPEDPAACMAFRYATLKLVRMDKLDLRHLVSNVFPGSYLDEKLMHWKRLIVHPFGADCRTLARGVTARLPEGDWVDLAALLDEYLDGPFVAEGFGPRAWSDADDEAVEVAEAARRAGRTPDERPATPATPAPPTTAGGGDARAALDALEAAVRQTGEEARGDLLLDVAALRLELERGRRERARMAARLDDVAARAPAAREACARVRAAIGT